MKSVFEMNKSEFMDLLKKDLSDFGAYFASKGDTLRGWVDYADGVSIELADLLSQYSENFDMHLVSDDVALDRIRFEITL